jgi:hypothetical protein
MANVDRLCEAKVSPTEAKWENPQLSTADFGQLFFSPSLSEPKVSPIELTAILQEVLTEYKRAHTETNTRLGELVKRFSQEVAKSLSIEKKEKAAAFAEKQDPFFLACNTLFNQYLSVTERFFFERERQMLLSFLKIPELPASAFEHIGFGFGQEAVQKMLRKLSPASTLFAEKLSLKGVRQVETILLTVLSKASLFAGGDFAICLLASSLNRRKITLQAFEQALAYSFSLAIQKLVEDRAIEEAIQNIVEEDRKTKTLLPKEKNSLIQLVCSVLHLCFVQTAFYVVAIAFQVPRLPLLVWEKEVATIDLQTIKEIEKRFLQTAEKGFGEERIKELIEILLGSSKKSKPSLLHFVRTSFSLSNFFSERNLRQSFIRNAEASFDSFLLYQAVTENGRQLLQAIYSLLLQSGDLRELL